MKKSFTLFLAMIMAISMLFCGTVFADAEEPYTFTTNIVGSSWNDYPDSVYAQHLLKEFNIILEGFDFGERKAAMLAAGELPDLVLIEAHERMPLIESGFIIPLDDLILEYGPDIYPSTEIMEYNRTSKGDGKNIYGLTTYYVEALGSGINGNGINLNVDWDRYAALGYPEVEATVDSLFHFLKEMVEVKPTTDDGLQVYATAYPIWGFWGNRICGVNVLGETWLNDYVSQNAMTGKLYSAYIDAESAFWENCRLMFKLNEAGLLDPDSLMGDSEADSIKAAAGQYAAVFFNGIAGSTNNLFAQEGKASGFVAIPVKNACAWGGTDYSYGILNMRAISANAEKPERIIELVNHLYTPDGAREMKCGFEGVTYDYNADGEPVLRQDFVDAYAAGGDAWNQYGLFKFNIGAADGDICSDGYMTQILFDEVHALRSATPLDQAVIDHYGHTALAEFNKAAAEGYTGTQGIMNMNAANAVPALVDEYKLIVSNAQTAVNEAMMQCTLAADEDEFIALRDAAIENLKASGMSEVYDWFYAEYEKAVEATK